MLRGPGAQVRLIVLKSIALMIQAFFQTDKIEKPLLLAFRRPTMPRGPGAHQAGAQVRLIVLKSIALMIGTFFQTDKIEKIPFLAFVSFFPPPINHIVLYS